MTALLESFVLVSLYLCTFSIFTCTHVIIHYALLFSVGSPFKITKLQQLSLSRHVYNLRSLVAVIPSSLCAESGSHDFADGYDHLDQPVSILINVSGKLLMIQQDRSASIEKSKVQCRVWRYELLRRVERTLAVPY